MRASSYRADPGGDHGRVGSRVAPPASKKNKNMNIKIEQEDAGIMKRPNIKALPVALLGATLAAGSATYAAAAETPVHGGILNFVVGSTIPSYDAHQETT